MTPRNFCAPSPCHATIASEFLPPPPPKGVTKIQDLYIVCRKQWKYEGGTLCGSQQYTAVCHSVSDMKTGAQSRRSWNLDKTREILEIDREGKVFISQ